jgi:branched-chain amino acid transport system permease protein
VSELMSRRPSGGTLGALVVLAVLLLVPFTAGPAILQTGLLIFAAVVAVIGLNLLAGSAGQLSLGHVFFVAVGAYSYTYLAADQQGDLGGRGLPPLVALVLAVAIAGLAGLLFSPVSSRLRGLSLGIASVSLVFIGTYILNRLPEVTGGFNGRSVPLFSAFGFTFGDDTPYIAVAGVQFDQAHRLWYLFLAFVVLSVVVARRVLKGRPGRAFEAVRDGEVQAAVSGVNVRRTKAVAFVLSSMYAGLGGVMLALALGYVGAETFTLTLTINYLAAIVIGGLGSVAGGVAGAAFVFGVPQLLNQYGERFLPFLVDRIEPGYLAQYLYGVAVVVVLLFEPDGLAALPRRIRDRWGSSGRGERPEVRTPAAEEREHQPV